MARPCKVCGGPIGILGVLGSMIHYQCRNCGINFCRRSKKNTDKKTTK